VIFPESANYYASYIGRCIDSGNFLLHYVIRRILQVGPCTSRHRAQIWGSPDWDNAPLAKNLNCRHSVSVVFGQIVVTGMPMHNGTITENKDSIRTVAVDGLYSDTVSHQYMLINCSEAHIQFTLFQKPFRSATVQSRSRVVQRWCLRTRLFAAPQTTMALPGIRALL
jgi:hypothetical protein